MIAIYAGSFDPITYGHLWMIEQGSKAFDQLIVGVGLNQDKKTFFDESTRLKLIKSCTKQFKNVQVESFSGEFLVHFAKKKKAKFILRGIRNTNDFDYEQTICRINQDIDSNIQSLFLMPPRDICEISSSMVRSLVGPKGWKKIVSQYVPQNVVTEFGKLKG
jgi:pantetheine-phosphate adenylyltransferase